MSEELNPQENGGQQKSRPNVRRGPRAVESQFNNIQKSAEAGKKLAENASKKYAKQAAQKTGKAAAKAAAKSANAAKTAAQLGKVAAQAGKIAAMAGKLAAILGWVAIIIIIIIVIIGLLVFLLTGLGYIMSGLKAIAESFWDTFVNRMVGTENNVKAEEIIDTLSYLDEMGYDLYGYGFVTKPEPMNITEIKDDDGNVTGEERELAYNKNSEVYKYIYSYLASDTYALTIKNFNQNWKKAFSKWENFLSGLSGGTGWGSGLIELWHQGDEIGKKLTKWDSNIWEPGAIKIENGSLIVENPGWGTNAFSYSLDGWTGRYSMPLEFLLSTHLATMAPDLSHKMATSFDTTVEILLYESNDGRVDAGVREIGTSEQEQTEQTEMEGIVSQLGPESWAIIDGVEALEVLQTTPLKSCEIDGNYKCTGPPATNIDGSTIGGGTGALLPAEEKETVIAYVNELLTSTPGVVISNIPNGLQDAIINTFWKEESPVGEENENGETQIDINIAIEENAYSADEIRFSINGGDKFITVSFDTNWQLGGEEKKIEYAKKILGDLDSQLQAIFNLTESLELSGDEECVEKIVAILNHAQSNNTAVAYNITTKSGTSTNVQQEDYTDLNRTNNTRYATDLSGTYNGETGIVFQLMITRSIYEINATGPIYQYVITLGWKHENQADILCSDEEASNASSACDGCIEWVRLIYKALCEVQVDNLKTYVPYINQVKNHWFRDVYFTQKAIGNKEIIKTDYEYEKKTDERWTDYETYEEDGIKQYELYIYIKDNGEYKTDFEGNVVCKKAKDGEGIYSLSDDGVTYIKVEKGKGDFVLKNKNGENNYTESSISPDEFRVGKKVITENVESGWTAYEYKELGKQWKQLPVNDDSPGRIKEAVELGQEFWYAAVYTTIEQIEDGVRGVTNKHIKELFLDDYYLFDGTGPRAALINAAKKKGGSDDPDKVGKDVEIEATYDGKKYTATIDEISGPINLTHSSLSAFSMLENMHTLDAEYIYHDFKELIVELNYFDKEELTEAKDEVMMFPVSGYSANGWPLARYDRSEEYYGTLIHSAQDYEARMEENAAELATLLESEGDDGIPDRDNSNVVKSGITVEQNAFLKIAEECHKEQKNKTYLRVGQTIPDGTRAGGSKYIDCSAYVSYVLYMAGFTDLAGGQQSSRSLPGWCEKQGWQKINNSNEIIPGDICFYHQEGRPDYNSHVNICAIVEGGTPKFWDCGCTAWIKSDVPTGHKLDRFVYAYRPAGITGAAPVEPFTGYAGSTEEEPEYVLSPVTGEVIKYGITKRENIETKEFVEENPDVTTEDYVGFIKIRLLGNIERLPGEKKHEYQFGRNSSHEDKKEYGDYFEEDDTKGDVDKFLTKEYGEKGEDGEITKRDTVGYDYFWEEYNDAGIGGTVVYIEGFDVADILGEAVAGTSENPAIQETDPKANSVDNIQKLADYIKSGEDPDAENAPVNAYSTTYVVPNLLDDNREFELDIAEQAKQEAVYTITQEIDDQTTKEIEKTKRIYIKEGAVIGKTYNQEDARVTDTVKIEVIDDTVEPDPEATEIPTVEKEFKVGNYMRVIYRDQKGEVIEDIEDYMNKMEGNNLLNGDVFVIPPEVIAAQKGRQITFEAINRPELGMSSWSQGSAQRGLYELWKSQGSIADNGTEKSGSVEQGIAVITIGGKEYIPIALKETYAKEGSQIQIVFENGDILDCIMMDAKGKAASEGGRDGEYGFWAVGDHGKMDYGHSSQGDQHDCNILEVLIKGTGSGSTYCDNFYPLMDSDSFRSKFTWWSKAVVRVIVGDQIFSP